MALTYTGNDGDDLFTLGSNHISTVKGGAGTDTIKITADQTMDVDAATDADSQIIEFAAGAVITAVTSSHFTYSTATITVNGALVTAHKDTIYKIGNAEYNATEFNEWFTTTNSGNSYTVGTTPAYEALRNTTSDAFTLTVDTADKTYADEANAMGKITATVAETTEGTSAKDVSVTFSTSTAFANNVISIDAEGTSGFYTMAGAPTVLIAEKATLEAAGITAASDEIVGTVGTASTTTMAVNFTHDNANVALINAFLTDVNIGNPANAVDATLTIKLTDTDGAVATDTVAIEVAADDAYNDITVTNFTTLLDSREVESSDIDAGPVKIDDGADFTLALGANLESNTNTLVEDMTVTITGARANDTLGFSNGDDETGAANTARFLGTDVYLNVAGTDTLVGSVTSIPVAGEDMVLTINEGVSLANANLLLKDLAITLENTSISDPQDVVALTVTIDSQSAAEAVVTPVNLTVVEDFTDITLADLVARTTGETNIDDSDTMEGNYNITVVNADGANTYNLSTLDISALGAVRILVTENTNTTTLDLETFGSNISYYKITDNMNLTSTAALLDGVAVRGDNNPTGVTVTIEDLQLALDADLSSIAANTNPTANFDSTPSPDAPFTGNLGEVTVAVANGAAFTTSVAKADEKTIGATGTGSIALTDLSAAEVDLSGSTAGAGLVTVTNTVSATLHEDTNLGTAALTIATGTTITALASQVSAKTVAGAGSLALTELGSTAVDLTNVDPTGTFTIDVPVSAVLDAATDLDNANVAPTITVAADATLTATAAQLTTLTLTGAGDVVVTDLTSVATDLSDLDNTGSQTVIASGSIAPTTDLGTFDVVVSDVNTLDVDAAQVSGLNVVATDSATLTFTGDTTDANASNDEGLTFNLNVAGTVHAVTVDLGGDATTNVIDATNAVVISAQATAAITALGIPGVVVTDNGGSVTVSSTTGDVGFDTVVATGTTDGLTATSSDTMTVTADTTLNADEKLTFNVNVDGTDYAVTANLGTTADTVATLDDVIVTAITTMLTAEGLNTDIAATAAIGGAGNVTVTSAKHDVTFNNIVATGTTVELAGATTATSANVTITNLDEALAANLSNISDVNGEATFNITVDEDTILNSAANLGDFQATVTDLKTLTLSTTQADGMTIVNDNNNGATTVVGLNATAIDLSTITTTTNTVQLAAATTLAAATNLGTFGVEMTTDNANLTLTADQANGITYDAGTTNSIVTITASTSTTAHALNGTSNDDIIAGSKGVDTITAGEGVDTITTGTGSDIIVYTSSLDTGVGEGEMDIITDFYYGGLAGGDIIDLSDISAIYGALTFISTASFTNGGNEVRYTDIGDDLIIEIDISSAATSADTDMQILIEGGASLVAADFDLSASTITTDRVIYGTADTDTLTGGAGNDSFIYTTTAELFVSNQIVDTIVGGAGTDDAIVINNNGGATFTIASGDDFTSNTRDIATVEAIKAGEATDQVISITLHATAATDGITTIDLSADTDATGTNVVDISNLTSTVAITVIGSAGIDMITGDAESVLVATGGAGNDTIALGTAGTADTVKISDDNGMDTITTFVVNEDFLNFTEITASGTLAKVAITNDGGTTLTETILSATNTTVYAIDTDATELGSATVAPISDFADMAIVAAFLNTDDGVTTSGTADKVDYFVINDADVITKSYLYQLTDNGNATTDVEAAELELIGTITTDAAIDVDDIAIA